MSSPRFASGFVMLAVMVFVLMMSAVSALCLELNMNALKAIRYCHKMDKGQ